MAIAQVAPVHKYSGVSINVKIPSQLNHSKLALKGVCNILPLFCICIFFGVINAPLLQIGWPRVASWCQHAKSLGALRR